MLLDFLVQSAFDVEVLDHGLDNEVTVFQLRQIVFKISERDEGSEIGSEKGGRFGFLCRFISGARNLVAIDCGGTSPTVREYSRTLLSFLGNDIEQERRDTCVGEMRGDL